MIWNVRCTWERRYPETETECDAYGDAWCKSGIRGIRKQYLKRRDKRSHPYLGQNSEDTFYIIGSAVGPYPYPKMVKEFQSVISREAKRQHMEAEGKNPDVVMACVGGGSNSIGMFADFIDEPEVELIGVEAAGLGIETGKHASAMALGEPGVLHGMRSYLLQDTDGNIQLAHSISAGLDYPGVGPEHAYLRDTGRAKYVAITDVEAMDALMELCKLEGIIPAIESAHAVAYAFKRQKK